jgi:hypothetical protein
MVVPACRGPERGAVRVPRHGRLLEVGWLIVATSQSMTRARAASISTLSSVRSRCTRVSATLSRAPASAADTAAALARIEGTTRRSSANCPVTSTGPAVPPAARNGHGRRPGRRRAGRVPSLAARRVATVVDTNGISSSTEVSPLRWRRTGTARSTPASASRCNPVREPLPQPILDG